MANYFSDSGAQQTYINKINATDRYNECEIQENGNRHHVRTIVLNDSFLWSMVHAPGIMASSEAKTMGKTKYDLITITISNINSDPYECWVSFSGITDGDTGNAREPSDRWVTVPGKGNYQFTTSCTDRENVDCTFQSINISAYFKSNPYRASSIVCQGSISGGSSGDDETTTTA